LSFDYFYSLTQRQFANVVNGYRKKKDFESRERWCIARKVMHSTLMPHLKEQITEIELLQFSWEEELAKKLEKEYDESYLSEIQNSIKIWDEIDEKRKAKA
jgi:hypothetical protein